MDPASCSVCGQELRKARYHYGGLTCYSCRAFFRRNCQRRVVPPCRAAKAQARTGSCDVSHRSSNRCIHCRYEACLSVGMQPHLVLDDHQINARFKKALQRKEIERRCSEPPQTKSTSPFPMLSTTDLAMLRRAVLESTMEHGYVRMAGRQRSVIVRTGQVHLVQPA